MAVTTIEGYLALVGGDKHSIKDQTGKSIQTVYDWLKLERDGVYQMSVKYDGRSKRIIRITGKGEKVFFDRGEKA